MRCAPSNSLSVRGALLCVRYDVAILWVVRYVLAESAEEMLGLFDSGNGCGTWGSSIAIRHCRLGKTGATGLGIYCPGRSNVLLSEKILGPEINCKTKDKNGSGFGFFR